jgi:prepilin-type N-terminal cleavage/methylation domain-containing protein
MLKNVLKIKKIFFNHRGVSLIEMIVAVSLFAITMLTATQIFKMVLDRQHDAIFSQDLQEGMRYAFERVGKEIRTAIKDETGACSGTPGLIYNVSGGGKYITFLNEYGNCVTYGFDNDTLILKTSDTGWITLPIIPTYLKIKRGFFQATTNTQFIQSKVLIRMELEVGEQGRNNQSIDVQTTLSSRYYE